MSEIRKAPDQTTQGRSDFLEDDFDVLVYQKGQEVVWEASVRCPCKLDGRGNIPSCLNCGGVGFVFINPIKTKMVLQSMNMSTKWSQWSLEKIGMTNITTRSVDVLGDMDRITLTKSISKISQVVRPQFFGDKLFAYTSYPIIKAIDVFMFKDEKSKLKLLSASKDYSVDGNKIILNKKLYTDEDMSLSIRYTHNIQYFVVDIPREIRQSDVEGTGKNSIAMLPVSGVGRRCHYIIKPDDFKGSSILDNSYK